MKTYSINTTDVEHSSAPRGNDSFFFSDDIAKWISSGKLGKSKEWSDKRRKNNGSKPGGRHEASQW